MRAFLRENLMIVVSTALPIVVVLLFALASVLPKLFTDPPAHNLVMAVDTVQSDTSAPVSVSLNVSKGRLRAQVYSLEHNRPPRIPRLFEYVAASQTVREIAIVLPDNVTELEDGSEIPLPEFATRRLVTTLRAPDGYEFENYSGGGGGLFREFFGTGRARHAARLRKNGAVVRVELPSAGSPYYYYYNVRFVGWVVD